MPIEYGDQSYFPSAKLRLIVRLDEFGTNALRGKEPKKTTPKLAGVKDDRAPLVVKVDPNSPPGLTRFLLVSQTSGGTTPGTGTAQQTSADGLSFEISGVIPAKATWKQNGIRTADTLQVAIRAQDFPLDPRVCRSIAVSFYLGTVTPQDFAQGIGGITRDVVTPNGSQGKEPLHVVPDTYTDGQGRNRTNLRFVGWVDKFKRSRSEQEAMVEFECVDNTRLLEKQVRPPRLVIGMEKPIDEAVAEYLSHFPQMEGITVEYLPTDTARADVPKLKTSLAHTAFVPQLGPPAGNAGATGAGQESVLDYLTSVVGSIAHSMRIDGTQLVIQRASNLFGTVTQRSDDPYQGRNLPSGHYPTRALIYGRNVLEESIEREFAKHEPKNCEVRSYDPHRKNVNVARFPTVSTNQLLSSTPGDGKVDKAWTVMQVSDGIRDKKVLLQIAEEIFNTIGRQELIAQVKTYNFASFGGDNSDPDLLDMKLGDSFEILAERAEADEGTLAQQDMNLSSLALNQQAMIDLGFSPDFALAYAVAYTNAGFQREFKMKEMSVEWDVDEGVSFEITGMNYVVARVDQPTTAGTDQS